MAAVNGTVSAGITLSTSAKKRYLQRVDTALNLSGWLFRTLQVHGAHIQ
jgi:hypothetical protein